MNTAALLPSPATAARLPGDAVADAGAEPALQLQEGFALALVASLDAGAEPAAQPLPVLPAPVAATPLPVALPDLPDRTDGRDTLEPLDPQSAFALAALGLLPVALLPQAPAPVAPAPAGDAPAAAGATLPVAPAPLAPIAAAAAAAAPALRAAPAEPRPAAVVQPLPAALPAASGADAAPDAAQAIAAARAAVAAAAPSATPAGVAGGVPGEAAAESLHKTERGSAGAELPAAVAPAAAALRPAAAPEPAQPGVVLKGEATQWQQPLLQALGDRLQLQIAARSDQAVIRLEPPMLGQVEIAIRQQAGDLQVRIAATHDEVTRQIQQVGEQLRQGLAQRHGGEVSVQVAQTGNAGREPEPRGGAQQQAAHDDPQQARDGQQQQQQQQQRRPGRGLDGAETASFAADLAAMKA